MKYLVIILILISFTSCDLFRKPVLLKESINVDEVAKFLIDSLKDEGYSKILVYSKTSFYEKRKSTFIIWENGNGIGLRKMTPFGIATPYDKGAGILQDKTIFKILELNRDTIISEFDNQLRQDILQYEKVISEERKKEIYRGGEILNLKYNDVTGFPIRTNIQIHLNDSIHELEFPFWWRNMTHSKCKTTELIFLIESYLFNLNYYTHWDFNNEKYYTNKEYRIWKKENK